jgi:N-acetylglucosaminyldiphosphoundecaprenol N-acetyl-beta-D-mannosaminyltransferase
MLGVSISLMTLDAIVARAMQAMEASAAQCTVAFANPHSLVVSQKDPAFHEALNAASIAAPDGTGIVLASRLRGGRIKARITGSDFFAALSQAMNRQGGRSCFFLGSTPDTLKKLRDKFERLYPSVTFAGFYSPPYREAFSPAENEEMIGAVNAARPDVLWVGMTAPKQEKWMHQNAPRLNVKVIAAIGAVFDYFTGNVRRPGKLWRSCGLEWLPRLLQEPRRLWRRNFVSTPLFLYMVVRERFRGEAWKVERGR